MLIFKKVVDLKLFLDRLRSQGRRIGFIPTMGALHDGHLSLINRAQEWMDYSVVSIFVNPTQFNDPNDLKKYPKPFAADVKKLVNAGTSILFYPPADEVYPAGLNTEIGLDFGELANVMEGEFRPGHFEGMANVVSRLLDIVEPDSLFMGLKDFQQLSIVRSMIRQQKRSVNLVGCSIIREEDGLAMSSRNARLSTEMRRIAPEIRKTLLWAADQFGKLAPREIEKQALKRLEEASFKPEYVSIADGQSLLAASDPEKHSSLVICTAVWAGEIRLIDNMILKGAEIIQGSSTKRVVNT